MFSGRSVNLNIAWARLPYPILGLVFSLASTLILYMLVARHEHALDQALFDAEAAKFVSGMRQSMTVAEVLLISASGLVSSHPDLSADEWRGFVDAPSQHARFAGFQGIGLLRYAGPQMQLSTRDANSSETDDVTRKNDRALELVMMEPSPWRDVLDLAGRDAVRRGAMERARDFDAPARTSMVRFPSVAGNPERKGFLVYAPVYSEGDRWETVAQRRRALVGFVVMPFAAHLLFPNLMQNRYREASPYFRIEAFDGRTTAKDSQYFDSAEHEGLTPQAMPALTTTLVADRFGTDVTFKLSSLPLYEAARISRLPEIIACGGVVLSLFIFVLLHKMRERQRSAEKAHSDSAALRVELMHRVRNVLAVVQSIANRSLSAGRDGAERQEQFANRLNALARAHTLIVENQWLGTAVGELMRSELAPIAHRATMSGPEIALGPQVAQSLALMVHEMAVNAMHRGVEALNISWQPKCADDGPTVVITWKEEGGQEESTAQLAQQIAMHGFCMAAVQTRRGATSQHVFSVPLD